MRNEHRKISQIFLRRLINRHRRRGRGGFKTDAKENNFLRRILFGEFHGIERRINNPHIAAFGLDRKQIRRAAGHAQHVAERGENHVWSRGDFQRLVNHLQRRHADRTARPVNERDLLRQQFINAEFHNRVRLAAADFHDVPRLRRDAVNFARKLLRQPHRGIRPEISWPCLLQFAQFFHLFQIFKNFLRLVLVHPAQREPDMDDDVIADRASGT
jgi:hypothetical protein